MTKKLSTREIQTILAGAGFDPGEIDGLWGGNTRRAVEKFQRARGLDVDGIVGRNTLAALLSVGGGKPVKASDLPLPEPPWMLIARDKLGLHETIDNKALKEFLKSDGRTLGDPSKLPWCGDFVQTCIAIALPNEPIPANPYLARNWMKFGRAVTQTVVGAVAVFARGTDGISGHVGFVAGESGGFLSILGGNQANGITISRLDKSRLLGLRYPKTIPLPGDHEIPVATGAITTNEA